MFRLTVLLEYQRCGPVVAKVLKEVFEFNTHLMRIVEARDLMLILSVNIMTGEKVMVARIILL